MTTRSRFKRSSSEMEFGPLVIDEDVKRSKLAAALLQQPQQQRRFFYNPMITTRSREWELHVSQQLAATLPQQQQMMIQPVLAPVAELSPVSLPPPGNPVITLPDLAKELAVLPALSDSGSVSSTSSWSSLSSAESQHQVGFYLSTQ